jgi:hypothetical protein
VNCFESEGLLPSIICLGYVAKASCASKCTPACLKPLSLRYSRPSIPVWVMSPRPVTLSKCTPAWSKPTRSGNCTSPNLCLGYGTMPRPGHGMHTCLVETFVDPSHKTDEWWHADLRHSRSRGLLVDSHPSGSVAPHNTDEWCHADSEMLGRRSALGDSHSNCVAMLRKRWEWALGPAIRVNEPEGASIPIILTNWGTHAPDHHKTHTCLTIPINANVPWSSSERLFPSIICLGYGTKEVSSGVTYQESTPA